MATYYVKNGGSDAADGLSDANAWETVTKVRTTSFNPGDIILFKRGDTWREQLWPSSSGSSGSPITYGAYDSGALPRITGLDVVAGPWSDAGANRWQASVSDPRIILIDDVYGIEVDGVANVDAPYEWDWTGGTLTIYSTVDPTGNLVVEGGVRWAAFGSNGQSWINVEDIDFDGGTGYVFSFDTASCTNWNIRRCRFDHAFLFGIVPTSSLTVSDVLVEDCVALECGAVSFQSNKASQRWTFRRCVATRGGQKTDAQDRGTGELGWGGGFKHGGSYTIDESVSCVWEECVSEDAGRLWNGGVSDFDHGWGIWIDTMRQTAGNEHIVRNCVARGGYAGGFFCEKTHFSIWHHNLAYNNQHAGFVLGQPFDPDPSETCHDNKIYHITCVNNGLNGAGDDSNFRVAGGFNVVVNTSQLVNNTVYNIICDQSGATKEFDARNGGDNGAFGSGNVYRYLTFGVESTGFIQWGATGYDTYAAWETAYGSPTNYVNGDPLLLGPPEYRLDGSSPAIDQGVVIPGINDGYYGTAPDLGWVEFVPATVTLPFLPNQAAASYLDQAEPDSEDFQYLLAGFVANGVVTGGGVTQSSPTGMTVDIAGGTVRYNGSTFTFVTAANLAIAAADPTNPRFDVVYWRASDQTIAVETGTPSTNPVLPTPLTGSGVQLAAVYVQAGAGQIFNDNILDKRVPQPEATRFNVKEYGALGNGSTDDTVAIQATVDAAIAAGGGEVFFPKGIYIISGSINIAAANDIKLRGVGPNATQIFVNANSVTAFNFTGVCQRNSVERMWIGTNSVRTGTTGISVVGTSGVHSDGFVFSNLVIQNLNQCVVLNFLDQSQFIAVKMTSSIAGAVTGVQWYMHSCKSIRMETIYTNNVVKAGNDGIRIDYDCDTVLLVQCEVTKTTGRSISLVKSGGATGPRLIRMTNCFVEESDVTGYYVADGRDVKMTACHSWVNGGQGFHVVGGDSVTMDDCSAVQNGEHGFYVTGGTGVKVDGCTASNNSQDSDATRDGIRIEDNVTNVRVVNNRSGDFIFTLPNGQRYGVSIGSVGTDYILCGFNDLSGNKTAGLGNFSSGPNNVIDHNAV